MNLVCPGDAKLLTFLNQHVNKMFLLFSRKPIHQTQVNRS